MLKTLIAAALAQMGYELQRKPAEVAAGQNASVLRIAPTIPRTSWEGALRQARSLGWQPQTVVDVGAAAGEFTEVCYGVFPDAQYLLIEPLTEHQRGLTALRDRIPNAAVALVVAGAVDGETILHVHADWVGSSVYCETEGTEVDGLKRRVPVRTLDALCQELGLTGRYLLKIDVQVPN